MSGETLASKLNKKLAETGREVNTNLMGDIMSIIDSHYRVVREQTSTYELEEANRKIQKLEETQEGIQSYADEVEKGRDHLAEVIKALEEALDGQQTRLRALKESINIVATPRGLESLFRPRPVEEERQRALVKTAEWVLNGTGKTPGVVIKNEAQAEYDSNPELRDTLDRASKSTTVKRSYTTRPPRN
jgi:cysteinyl-tRNA synthetase